MGKILPHLAGRKQWQYTAWSMHYQWSTIVVANSIKEARRLGMQEAKYIFGNHARVHRDEVVPLA